MAATESLGACGLLVAARLPASAGSAGRAATTTTTTPVTYVGVAGGSISFGIDAEPDRLQRPTRRRATRPATSLVLERRPAQRVRCERQDGNPIAEPEPDRAVRAREHQAPDRSSTR